jgi:hypothetical protein
MEYDGNLLSDNSHNERDNNELIAQLTKEKELYVSEGRYLEAENIKIKINELKDNLTDQKKRDLNYQHIQEMQNLENNYNNEIFDSNKKWENIFNEFNNKAADLESGLFKKHKNEMEGLLNNLENKLPKQTKYSKEFLDLKQSEMGLVKQERYVEAHFIKLKCDAMEKSENEKYNKERNDKIKIKVDQLIYKQNLEKNALKQKLDTEYEMMKKMKEDENHKIYIKFKNRKADLEAQHKQEKFLRENENMLKASKILFYK